MSQRELGLKGGRSTLIWPFPTALKDFHEEESPERLHLFDCLHCISPPLHPWSVAGAVCRTAGICPVGGVDCSAKAPAQLVVGLAKSIPLRVGDMGLAKSEGPVKWLGSYSGKKLRCFGVII